MPRAPLPRAPRRAPLPPPPLVGAPRAIDDPLARSPLPPFARARRFLEHAGALSRRGWDDAIARSLAPDARLAATRRVAALIAEHPQSRAMDALARAAQQAARDAVRDRRLATGFETRAAGLASHAAFALALREQLATREFEVLYAPFVRGA